MKRVIGVCLGNAARQIGDMRYDRQGARKSAAFAYATQWLAASEHFAICHRLFARTSCANPASMRVLEKAGFTREGILRDAFQRNGVFVDEALYGLLAPEWRAAQERRG